MDLFLEKILTTDKVICDNIDKREALGIELLSQNIVAQLRNFVEAIARFLCRQEKEIADNQKGTQTAISYIKSKEKYLFLVRFHKCLQVSASHSTVEPDVAIRLMHRYWDYLYDCKNFLKKEYDIDVLRNLDNFPIEQDETLKEYLKGEIIFARMAPDQKYRIVSLLQDLGEIVAVTGDGVNDAPALKKANIGIAMGITGTDVAKEAADMILTDDNFASIVKAVKEGRAIFDNIKKFITYIFNSNIPEAIPFLLPLLTINAIPPMLTILEVLLIDIGTDMLPALALGSEKPGDNIMDRPPRKLNEHLITKKLYGKALYYGLQTSILCVAAYFIFLGFYALDNNLPFTLYSQTNNEAVWMSSTTVVFASIIFCQIGIVYNCRSDETSIFKLGLTSNKEVLYGIVAEIALLMIVTYVPFINTEVFETNQILDWKIWLVILTFPFIVIAIDETRKYFIRRRKAK